MESVKVGSGKPQSMCSYCRSEIVSRRDVWFCPHFNRELHMDCLRDFGGECPCFIRDPVLPKHPIVPVCLRKNPFPPNLRPPNPPPQPEPLIREGSKPLPPKAPPVAPEIQRIDEGVPDVLPGVSASWLLIILTALFAIMLLLDLVKDLYRP